MTTSNTTTTTAPGQRDDVEAPGVPWAYRRRRQHLFPLEKYRAAKATGGAVRAFCGVLEQIPAGEPDTVASREAVLADDCATCVDVWQGRSVVRL